MKNKVNVKISFLLFSLFLMVMPGCASSKKDNYLKNKARVQTHISTTQLGRNKYYFSAKYQKKLSKYKRK